MKESERHRVDEMLDLLAEEVAERLRTRSWTEAERPEGPAAAGAAAGVPRTESEEVEPPAEEAGETAPAALAAGAGIGDTEAETAPAEESERASKGAAEEIEPGGETETEAEPTENPPAPSYTARLLGRMALGLLVLVAVINIPFNRHGKTLATAMPDNRALVIRNGLVVKEEDDPEIYVYEDGAFRWISSLDAFEYRGYTWEDVHSVEDGFLEDYTMGPPIHVLVKCDGSPHIYRVEGEKKRWIVDLEAFEAAGHVWEDVQFVPCATIRSLPNGETIPPGHGPAPEP